MWLWRPLRSNMNRHSQQTNRFRYIFWTLQQSWLASPRARLILFMERVAQFRLSARTCCTSVPLVPMDDDEACGFAGSAPAPPAPVEEEIVPKGRGRPKSTGKASVPKAKGKANAGKRKPNNNMKLEPSPDTDRETKDLLMTAHSFLAGPLFLAGSSLNSVRCSRLRSPVMNVLWQWYVFIRGAPQCRQLGASTLLANFGRSEKMLESRKCLCNGMCVVVCARQMLTCTTQAS